MKLTMLLCDHAAAAEGKLYVNGGGWNLIGPEPAPTAIAVLVEVPWTQANRRIPFVLRLFHEDGAQIAQEGPDGPQPVEVAAEFEVGRPPGAAQGSALPVPMAVNLPPLWLAADSGYFWQAEVDGEEQLDWRLSFRTRPAPPPEPPMRSATDPTAIPGL